MGSDAERRLRFAVLGPLRAWRGAERLDLGPVRQQAFLAGLVLRPDVTVSQRELLDGVWGDEPPGTGLKVVPGYVYRLRKCLRGAGPEPAVICGDRGGYRFRSRGVPVDAALLEQTVAEADVAALSGDLTAAVDGYDRALALYEGEPLAGLPGPFAAGERRRLAERRIALSQRKLEWLLRLNRPADAIGELSALTAAHPHDETLAALLIRALHAGGRRADALSVFAELRRRLVEELGVEPGEEVRAVHQAVLRGDDTALATRPPGEPPGRPAGARRVVRDELPVDTVELVGRDQELAVLTAPVAAGTVSVDAVDGVAGAGKTALAVRAARSVRARFPDGCLFVDLHGHSDGRDALTAQRVLRRLLRSVGFDERGVPDDLDELAACWRSATAALRLLLLLDDASGAEQVRPLLPSGPGSKVLVTSRQRLTGLDAGNRISLGPLGLGSAEVLLDRMVGSARSGGEQQAVRELARLCGRLPLALRIAGARLQNRPMWTYRDLVARLADDGNRLGELTAEDRSVEAAFRISYQQLPATERRAFRVLGLAPSPELDGLAVAAMLGWARYEAERVLERLVDTNLVQEPAAGRYRLHDLVAVFARRLAAQDPEEVAVARTRLLDLYVTATRCASEWDFSADATESRPDPPPFSGGEDASAWLDAAGDLTDVVGHAAAAGLPGHACRIVEGAADYLVRQGRYHECRSAIEIALPLTAGTAGEPMASALRFCLGYVDLTQGRLEQARHWFADAMRCRGGRGDRRDEARALAGLGVIAAAEGDHTEAVGLLTEVMTMADELDDPWLVERAASQLGYIQHVQGRHEEALARFAQFRVLAEKLGNPAMTARTLCFTGSVHLARGRFAEAAIALRQAAELAEQVVDVMLHLGCLTRLGTAEQELGNLDAALGLQRRALAGVSEEMPGLVSLEVRYRYGLTCLAAGRPAEARAQFEQALALADGIGHAQWRADVLDGLDRCGPR
ncbi:tetratricopeptide repeat protein [Saccharopolyspora erythraea]|uniref:AfsR/SARP family transcriptional regulator n=1 Tax=Saccharopolyspora erythraea TaxID=1836 RepID=UPI001BAB3F2B|nr:BTAD domain-containing putative transcriptional regulator [Saccharopolyspora erythraea]QUH03519.1 tetratricopeptide repeat protein [Saccharopolyspora erythraea]